MRFVAQGCRQRSFASCSVPAVATATVQTVMAQLPTIPSASGPAPTPIASIPGPVATPTPVAVKTLTGMTITVQGKDEADYYIGQQLKYMGENTFTAISDLTDLDRMLFAELEVYRATCWLAAGRDYEQNWLSASEIAACRKTIKENGVMISSIKNDLALTKSQREKEQYASVGGYINDLKARAREHGVNREKQLTKALSLVHELFSMVGTYDRSDEVERQKLGLENSDVILDWVREVMEPEFKAIDEHFRQNAQRFWIRTI